jgi:two-component system sensor histidine kinase/response regulator
LCGNIGATGAQAQAEALERALKDRQPREALDALVAQLRSTLEPLVAAIAASLPPEAQRPRVATAVDEAVLERVTAQLRALCADMDSGAEDLLNQHDTLLHSAFPQQAHAIGEAIRDFDFDLAVEQLDAALQARRA